MQTPSILQTAARISIRTRLMTLVLVVTMPLSALWAWYAWSEIQDSERDNYGTVHLVVSGLALTIKKTLSDYETVTERLVREFEPERKRWSPQFNPLQFVRLHPDVVSLGFYQPEGPTAVAAHPTAVTMTLPRYLELAFLQGQASGHYGVSGTVWEPAAQRWVTVLTRPIHSHEGAHIGLVYLTLDLQKLNASVLGANNSDIVLPVIDKDNRFLMRSLEPEKWIGKALPAANIALIEGKRNENFAATDIQGHRRLYAMQTLEGSGWRVFAGMRETVALDAAHAKARQSAALGLFSLLLLLVLVWRNTHAIAQPIGALTQTVRQMRQDPAHRFTLEAPPEIAQVGQQLNALLDQIALEKQERKALADHYGHIVNNARDFIFLMDESKRIVDCNPAALDAYGYSLDALRAMTANDLRAPQAQLNTARDWESAGTSSGVLFETVHRHKSGATFPVEVSSNRLTIDGKAYVQSFVRDISARKQTELALASQTRALVALSACNHALIGATTVQALLDQVCQVLVTAGGYRLAWVGRPEHDAGKHIHVWAQSDGATDYLGKLNLTWADTAQGRGPTGTAVRDIRTVLAQDLQKQANYEPWRAAAVAQGFAASIALPLVAGGNCLGVLTVYAGTTDVFDPTEVKLLEELAGNVAYGLSGLQMQQRADHLENQLGASDRRFQMLIERSPAGIYVIRHGIFVYANPRMDEIMGVAYGDLVGRPAQDFVLPQDWHIVTEANERMNLLGSTGNLQVRCRRQDGVEIEIGLQHVTSDYEGEPAIIGMAQDISERNRAQAEIAHYIQRLENTTEATLQAVSNMVEMRDPYTAGHERRCGDGP